jgi:hypothetical protein
MSELTYTEEEVNDTRERFYREGYCDAVRDFGIWKDGVQRIGCLETPIKEVLARRFPNTPCDPKWKSVLDEVSSHLVTGSDPVGEK